MAILSQHSFTNIIRALEKWEVIRLKCSRLQMVIIMLSQKYFWNSIRVAEGDILRNYSKEGVGLNVRKFLFFF